MTAIENVFIEIRKNMGLSNVGITEGGLVELVPSRSHKVKHANENEFYTN
jgi:hypothetical protein